MQTSSGRNRVAAGSIVMAGVLLVGVLLVSYGFFQESRIALWAGLIVIVGGVSTGVVRILTQPHL